jgi:hypothetical protein
VIFHGESPDVSPNFSPLKKRPLRSLAVELEEIDPSAQPGHGLFQSILHHLTLRITHRDGVKRVFMVLEANSSLKRSQRRQVEIDLEGLKIGPQKGFEPFIRFVCMNRGAGKAVTGSQAEKSEIGADIEDGFNFFRDRGETVAIVQKNFAALMRKDLSFLNRED